MNSQLTRILNACGLCILFGSTFVLRSFAAEPDDLKKLETQRCPKPTEFANVFSLGYAGDAFPKEDEQFEKLLKKLKGAGFNVVHCTYSEKRLELCQKNGMLMMIDLLAEDHHIYRKPDAAKALCEKLKENKSVWGYNVWNDSIRKTYEGRRRDLFNVRMWDPNHPAFCGTYRVDGMNRMTNVDVQGYYDYHWKRNRDHNFQHLIPYWKWAKERDAFTYRWIEVDPGIPSKGNFNRCLHTVNTSIACGVKGVMWFLGTQMIDMKTLEWTLIGEDIARVNEQFVPLRSEMARIGNPTAIHSTTITKTLNNDPLPDKKESMLPPGLEQHPFPKDFWIQPTKGEFVAGFFKDKEGHDYVFLANHNAYAEHEVQLSLTEGRKTSLFSRKEGKWQEVKLMKNTASLKLDPAGGELLRFEK